MIDAMGIFRTTIQVAPLLDPANRVTLPDVMVDTGAEFSWIPRETLAALRIRPVRPERFQTADGRVLERDLGYAMLFAAGRESPTIVVFAEPGDMVLLGAYGLEGLVLRIDLTTRELVPAGPVPVAAAA